MPQYTVITKRLNIRSKVPVQFPDADHIIGEILEGQTFEANEADITEVPNRNLGKWYKDRNNHFYWGGGVTEQLLPTRETPALVAPQWMVDLNIPEIWSFATGKNIGIAVVDTGIDMGNPDLIFDKNKFFLFDQGVSLADVVGHGTHCSGLVGARNKNGNSVGVAFDSKIFVCKIADSDFLPEENTVRYADAINWCASQNEIQIISISWGSFINSSQTIDKIQGAINNAVAKNKVVVCAMGDASQLNDPGPLYPAALENTIGVGAIPVDNFLYPYINKSLCTSVDGFNIPSFGSNNQIIEMSGTSQSNAITAGIIALIIEKKKLKYSPDEIKRLLLSLSTTQVFQGVSIPVLNSDLLLKFFQN